MTLGIDVVFGVVLLYGAGRSLIKGTTVGVFDPNAISVAAVVLLGVIFSASNFSSLILALAASKDIGVAAVPPFDKLVAFVFVLAILLSWVWVLVAVYLVTPGNFDRLFDPVIHFMRKHGGQLMAVIFFLIGLYSSFEEQPASSRCSAGLWLSLRMFLLSILEWGTSVKGNRQK